MNTESGSKLLGKSEKTQPYDMDRMRGKPKSSVDHPAHYAGNNSVECINFIREFLGDKGTIYFCLGNAVKYMWRRGLKDPLKEQEDRDKAAWYFDEAKKIANGTLSFDINKDIKMWNSMGVKNND